MKRVLWLIPPLVLAGAAIVWLRLPGALQGDVAGADERELGAVAIETVEPAGEFWEDNTPADFILADLPLWATGPEVFAKLGQAQRVEQRSEPSPHDPEAITVHWEIWYYPGIELYFINSAARKEPRPAEPGNLWQIKVTSPAYPTARGVAVGDPLDRVFERYGETGGTDGWYYYLGTTEDLAFHAPAGKVEAIVVLAEAS